MKPTTIRWPDAFHRAIEARAREQGVPFAQYVREAAIARWAFEEGLARGRGQDPGTTARWEGMMGEIRDAVRRAGDSNDG